MSSSADIFPIVDAQVEQRTRGRILAQALPLFADQGYRGVTMREIAAAAGLTIGTLYHYFPGKRALYLAVLEQAYRGAAREWASVLTARRSPLERLRTYVRQYCAYVADNPDFVRLVKREQLEGDDEQMALMARTLFAEQHAATAGLLGEVFPDRDPTLLVHSLLGLVLHHYEISALRRHFPDHAAAHDDPGLLAEHVLELLLRGLPAGTADAATLNGTDHSPEPRRSP